MYWYSYITNKPQIKNVDEKQLKRDISIYTYIKE